MSVSSADKREEGPPVVLRCDRFRIFSSMQDHRRKDGSVYVFEAEDLERDGAPTILKTAPKFRERSGEDEEHESHHTPCLTTTAKHLQLDKKICERLADTEGVPKVVWYGEDSTRSTEIFAMERLGPDLYRLLKANKGKGFKRLTVFKTGLQVLHRLQSLHRLGYVHRDVKPSNVVVGAGDGAGKLFLIDFGLCKTFKLGKNAPMDDENHVGEKQDKCFAGTMRYLSLNVHDGWRATRRDDMEGLAYLLLELSLGNVPWEGAKTREEVAKEKRHFQDDWARHERYPRVDIEVIRFFNYARQLEFAEKPDYTTRMKIFRQRIKDLGGPDVVEDPEKGLDWLLCPSLVADALPTRMTPRPFRPKKSSVQPRRESSRDSALSRSPSPPPAARESPPAGAPEFLEEEGVGPSLDVDARHTDIHSAREVFEAYRVLTQQEDLSVQIKRHKEEEERRRVEECYGFLKEDPSTETRARVLDLKRELVFGDDGGLPLCGEDGVMEEGPVVVEGPAPAEKEGGWMGASECYMQLMEDGDDSHLQFEARKEKDGREQRPRSDRRIFTAQELFTGVLVEEEWRKQKVQSPDRVAEGVPLTFLEEDVRVRPDTREFGGWAVEYGKGGTGSVPPFTEEGKMKRERGQLTPPAELHGSILAEDRWQTYNGQGRMVMPLPVGPGEAKGEDGQLAATYKQLLDDKEVFRDAGAARKNEKEGTKLTSPVRKLVKKEGEEGKKSINPPGRRVNVGELFRGKSAFSQRA